MITTKRIFIPQCLEIFRRELEKELPDEDFEDEMIKKAYCLIYEMLRHVKG